MRPEVVSRVSRTRPRSASLLLKRRGRWVGKLIIFLLLPAVVSRYPQNVLPALRGRLLPWCLPPPRSAGRPPRVRLCLSQARPPQSPVYLVERVIARRQPNQQNAGLPTD